MYENHRTFEVIFRQKINFNFKYINIMHKYLVVYRSTQFIYLLLTLFTCYLVLISGLPAFFDQKV